MSAFHVFGCGILKRNTRPTVIYVDKKLFFYQGFEYKPYYNKVKKEKRKTFLRSFEWTFEWTCIYLAINLKTIKI